MSDTGKLLPCPFCGGKAEVEGKDNYSVHTFWRKEDMENNETRE